MEEKLIVNIKKIDEISKYQNYDITNFLVPLKDFCVGYDEITIEDILKIKKDYYLLINRILDNKDIDSLKKILRILNNQYLKGIFFEDIGVLEIIKELNLDIEKIYFPNHFATNYASINAFFERMIDSIVVSNEITYEEVKEITNKVNKPVILQVLGYNQIMYSRRNLITNFNKEYKLDLTLDNTIEEKISKKKLPIKENKYGTIIFDENIYNNLELLNIKNNVKFFYINSSYLNIEKIIEMLKDKKRTENTGFLHHKTIYKIGDINE